MTLHSTFYCQLLLLFYVTGVKKNPIVSAEDQAENVRRKRVARENPVEFKVRSWNSSIFAPKCAPDTSTLEFKDARTTVACIHRSFFRVASSSARLLAQHASRRIASRRSAPRGSAPLRSALLRNMRGGFARARGRRGRTGRPTSWRAASRQRVPSAAPSVCVCLGSRRPRLYVVLRSRLSASCTSIEHRRPSTSPSTTSRRGAPATVTLRSWSIDRSHVTDPSRASFLPAFRRSSGPGESLTESLDVPGWPENSQNSPIRSFRVLGEVCEISRDFANTPEATRSIWDISQKFKET